MSSRGPYSPPGVLPPRPPRRATQPVPSADTQKSIASPIYSSYARPEKDISEKPAQDHSNTETAAATRSADIEHSTPSVVVHHVPRKDKASQVLGIQHRKSMEPIPASTRNSIVSTRSMPAVIPPTATHVPTTPLTSLYVVSGLPKSPQTWTLADPEAVQGLVHSDGAVSRWWRAEVLGSTVSPGVGGGRKKRGTRHGKDGDIVKGAGALTKHETAKMLSKALKLSFTREVEIIASTLQPASTVHTFTFTLPAPSTPLAPPSTIGLSTLRSSMLSSSTADNRFSNTMSAYGTHPYTYADHARPSSAYLGPNSAGGHETTNLNPRTSADIGGAGSEGRGANSVTYHGVCLTVWSHADGERSSAIRRTLETARLRKESAQSLVAARLKALRTGANAAESNANDPVVQARRNVKGNRRGPWGGDGETDPDTDGDERDGAVSESDFDIASTVGHGPGESTLFLPGDTVFWLPYALTLVSRHPVYDLMRDYLTLSWARFSKDVASHTLQVSKILSHPAPRAGDVVRLDASPKEGGEKGDGSLEVVARFPGGLDFGRGLVDINFTMWPLFKCLNIDNILSICEIALAPTGRILFFSKNPAMLGIAVATIKYLVELRGWNGIALPSVHSRDARIYIEDPGPWVIGLAAEMRYAVRPPPEVCVCDLDINYLNCPMPPPGCLSVRQQRDRYRQRLLAAFGEYYHPDHSVPIEFKEAFPAGRFRPICKIQAKRGASSTIAAESIKPPEWWHSTRIIQAFDAVLADRFKKPSLLKRISSFGQYKRPPQLTNAEQQVQRSIRKRATAFVDARDDLETKIGRLSRRLNFLMTESDLWREKFVTFEQYAEKLSGEASELRAKISKEQRESKRLTGLISMTAAEKTKLQAQLADTENAHKEATEELERMRLAMDKMEEERAQMVAEVEAQIERALASMAVDLEDSDYDSSQGVGSPRSASAMSRRSSNAAHSAFPLRSIGTESTLAEEYEEEQTRVSHDAIKEENEQAIESPSKKKRFSTGPQDQVQDIMTAVDEGIHDTSDRIAQKVLQIQEKLESALAADKFGSGRASHESDRSQYSQHSAHESVGAGAAEQEDVKDNPVPSPTLQNPKVFSNPHPRTRSSTASSGRTTTQNVTQTTPSRRIIHLDRPEVIKEPSPALRRSLSSEHVSESSVTSSVNPVPSISSSYTASPPTPTATNATTEDSDTDFQSAYSASPRDSYLSLDDDDEINVASDKIVRPPRAKKPTQDDVVYDKRAPGDIDFSTRMRDRVVSNATTVIPAQMSPVRRDFAVAGQ
ncbi:hypothetical protein BD410DRAFT_824177 [Rickenella mellea]|uniref:cDENN domain-containing protein n=1 Tax=Rickenella mellea TaxID=50990 RepID=A0A4Y7QMH0_9AGAM|nr:hypothetical protein BD410DRAFT_824177 [Rickenella mellea]